MSKKGWIYLIGVVILGLTQAWLRTALGDPLAFAVCIAYLLACRLVAEKFGK